MPQEQKQNELDRLLQKILLDRALARTGSGKLQRAASLLRAILLDFPENRRARDHLGLVYLEMAQKNIREGNPSQARQIIKKALTLDPENQAAGALLNSLGLDLKIEPTKAWASRLHQTAKNFVEHYYPDQSKWFDLAWRIFKGVAPEELQGRQWADALGAVGEEESGRVLSHVVVMLSALAEEPPQRLNAEKLDETIRRMGTRLDADEKMINQLIPFAIDSLHSFQSKP